MSAEEESGFSVVDKRRVDPEAPAAENAPEPETHEAPDASPQPESDRHPNPAELPALSMRDRLLMCVDILHQGAWVALGLVADPATGKIEKDLDQAKAGIDCVAFLAARVENELDESTRRELKRVVSDLQVNFVRQAQK